MQDPLFCTGRLVSAGLKKNDASENLNVAFWPGIHKWQNLCQSGKEPYGGKVEIGNVKCATGDFFSTPPPGAFQH